MIKVCFVSWHYQNTKVFLDTLIKMTPGLSGVWKNIVAITDPDQADYVIVCDGANIPIKNPESRVIFMGNHPTGLASYLNWHDKPALLKLTLDKHLNNGEWWIEHTYDELMALQCPVKTKDLVCVCTGHNHLATGAVDPRMYIKRLEFLGEYCKKYSNLRVYGRPIENYFDRKDIFPYYKGVLGHRQPDGTKGEHLVGKETVLYDTRYSIEFDVGPTVNYISERVYDSLLLWCYPFYFGSTNVEKFIPKDSFQYINTSNLGDVDLVNSVVSGNCREDNLKAIEEARYLLLNKYQTFAYTYHVINNLDKFKAGMDISQIPI